MTRKGLTHHKTTNQPNNSNHNNEKGLFYKTYKDVSCLNFLDEINQSFQSIVFLYIVIFTTFRAICPLAVLRRFLLNSGAYTKIQTLSFI